MEAGAAISFGRKNAWLAVNAQEPARVIAALGLRDVREASWREGIEAAYGDHRSRDVFITPSIEGWVLVVGTVVSEVDIERVVRFSDVLGGEVIRFSTHRVVGHDAWIRADRGQLVRAYEYSEGQVVLDQGTMTAEEHDLGLADGPPEEEETVLDLAEAWSINPDLLDDHGVVGLGQIGRL